MCYEHLMFFTIFPADPRCSQQRSWIRWLWNTRGTYRGDSLAHWWMVLRGFDSHRFVSTTSEQPIQRLRSIDFKSTDPNQLWLKLEFWWGFYEYDNLKAPHLHLLGLPKTHAHYKSVGDAKLIAHNLPGVFVSSNGILLLKWSGLGCGGNFSPTPVKCKKGVVFQGTVATS